MQSFLLDDLWQPLPAVADHRLRHWLLDRGSLTRRIQSRCAQFRVDLLSQRLAAVEHDVTRIMGVRPRAHCVVREVCLACATQPLVYAYSVVAPRALRGPWHLLATLGTQPLGAALFADPCVRRHPLRFRHLGPAHPLYRRAARLLERPPTGLWARRSLFVLRRSRLLVTEVFLPAILGLAP